MSRMKQGLGVAALMIAGCAVTWAQEPPAPGVVASAPVVVGDRKLFDIQTNLGPFSAQERAAAAAQRIVLVAEDVTASVDAITTVVGETSTDIALGGRILLTVSDADARAAGVSRNDLATARMQSIRSAVVDLRADYSTRSLLMGVLEALAITLAFVALLVLLKKLRGVSIKKLQSVHIRPINIQKVEFVSARKIKRFLIHAVKAIRVLLVLIAFYLYLPLILSLFPWTRQYAPTLIEYLVSPLRDAATAVLDYLPSLFVVVLCGAGAYLLIRISSIIFRAVEEQSISWPGFFPEWAAPTHKIVRFLILAFAMVVVFPYLPGSSSPAFQGVSIFIGVLLSLGSTSAVANIIGGVILTYTRAFHIGDRVKIADTIGDVTEKTLLATRIQTIKNEFITIPNSMVLSSHIVNFSSFADVAPLVLHSTVTIGYDAPWRQVHELLIAAALRTPRILKEPAPFVLQTSLDDFYVSYQINAYTGEPTRMAATYAELHQNIQDCFNDAGVEIMSPHYGALRDGNLSTIPSQHLPKNYAAPGFRFENIEKQPPAGERGRTDGA